MIEYDGKSPDKVILDRIVAQVNVLAHSDEWESAISAGLLPDSSEMKISGVPSAYDLLTGRVVDEKVTVTYAKARLIETDCLLGRAYCFASDNISVTIGLYDGNDKVNEITVMDLDVLENRKMNILGMSLTE